MEKYKGQFIDFLLETGALKVGDKQLKSKRVSPYFVNIGDFNDGVSTTRLGEAYAESIKNSGIDFDLLYGIPEKGVALAIAASVGLGKLGVNKPWFFTRKMPKEYGEATKLAESERSKALIVGRAPQIGQKVALLDDVFTTGDAKYEALETLGKLIESPQYPLLSIAVDRQEVGIGGKSAIEEFTRKTEIPVISIVNAVEIYEHLQTKPDMKQADLVRVGNYLRVYGTPEARQAVNKLDGPLVQKIISRDRSVIPACDISDLEKFEELVELTSDNDKIGGYKIGFSLGLRHGLGKVVEVARKYTDKTLIYDHQKAGTDIPDTGKDFAKLCSESGIDAIILFPQAGPETERSWIYNARDHGLHVIVGGRMTHPAYSQSEGGWITDEGALEMYRIAAQTGVNHFVVPGNKPDVIAEVKKTVEAEGVNPIFLAPGFVAQGGKIEETTKVAGDRWHAIIGRGIYEAEDFEKAAREFTSQL